MARSGEEMENAALDSFERFIAILKVGGGYAGWALFIWMWWRADKRLITAQKDLKDIALAKLENDVKTEETLKANARGLEGIGGRLEKFGDKYEGIKNTLEKILLLKSNRKEV